MSPNVLLALMLASYAIPIVFVYFKHAADAADSSACRSISSIITSTEPFCLFTATTTAATTAPPPTHICIPNETLYRTVYAHNGGVHRAI